MGAVGDKPNAWEIKCGSFYGMVSKNLSRLVYAGKIIQKLDGNGNVLFLDTWLRFAREDRAVALQYNYQ